MSPVGVLLAAGPGTRLGMPGALMVGTDGVPWVVSAVEVMRAAGCDPIGVVVGASADEAVALLADSDVTIIPNPDWAIGLSSSVRAGLTWAAESDAVRRARPHGQPSAGRSFRSTPRHRRSPGHPPGPRLLQRPRRLPGPHRTVPLGTRGRRCQRRPLHGALPETSSLPADPLRRSFRLSEEVFGVDDGVGVALFGEEALAVGGELGVDGVARDDRVEPGGPAVTLRA